MVIDTRQRLDLLKQVGFSKVEGSRTDSHLDAVLAVKA
jgi:hypothetical protein